MMDHPHDFEHHDFWIQEQAPCALQVANGALRNVILLIGLVFGFRVLKHFELGTKTVLSINILATIGIVVSYSSDSLKALIVFNTVGWISLMLAKQKVPGYIVLAFNICLLIAIQLACTYFNYEEFFLSIRGFLMMHIMRLSTVAFRTQNLKTNLDKLTNFAGFIEYVYYPPLIIFGPYLTYDQFITMRDKKQLSSEGELGTLMKFATLIFVAITLAIMSSCHFEFYSPTSQFIEDVLTALSFRFSHYFVCLMGQAFIVYLGSEVMVTDPLNIEFSRSVVAIVSLWNQPFHLFLHKYIFQLNLFNSTGLNAMLTFVVSALLHGLDFQMAITLLALGFIAYSETMFRKRLAARFSMCVKAKQCPIRANRLACGHRHNSIYGRSTFINLFFGALSMYHLVFTGMTFTDDYSAIGYPLDHAWTIWGTHYYASFVISFVFLALSKII